METKQITAAIIKVMEEVNSIGKNTTVGTGNNSYKAVSDKDVKEAIRVSMIKNGLSIASIDVQGTRQIDRWEEEVQKYGSQETMIKTKQSVFTDVTTKYELSHTSGETKIIAGYGQGVDTQDKGAGKATTYALKNTLINLFLVPTGEDTDNTHSDDIAVPQKKTVWYNDTDKHIDQWSDLVAEGKTTGKAILDKITITDGKSIKKVDREKILNLDK